MSEVFRASSITWYWFIFVLDRAEKYSSINLGRLRLASIEDDVYSYWRSGMIVLPAGMPRTWTSSRLSTSDELEHRLFGVLQLNWNVVSGIGSTARCSAAIYVPCALADVRINIHSAPKGITLAIGFVNVELSAEPTHALLLYPEIDLRMENLSRSSKGYLIITIAKRYVSFD